MNSNMKKKFSIVFTIFLILFIITTVNWIKNYNDNKIVRVNNVYSNVNEKNIENYNDNVNYEIFESSVSENEFQDYEKSKIVIKKIKVIKVKEDEYNITDPYSEKIKIHKSPYYDTYGVNLNQYIIDEMENKAINNNTMAKVEDWDLYTPPCPNLHPIHYPDKVLNPVCEDIAIPFFKVSSENYTDSEIPIILRLHSITTQMEKWEEWLKSDNKPPNYNDTIQSGNIEYLLNDEYHPYDYGYYEKEISKESNEEYYKKVIKSRMDEVPDPRRRRLYSIILFNSEFELLDLYLAQYYEIFDYFIIYESNSTFSGYAKPLYLTRTLLETNRYEKFRDKIIPITLPILDVKDYDLRGPGFPREHLARREVIEKGLRAVNARHGDIFIHGDLDELPKPRLVSYLKKCGGWEHLLLGIGGGPKPIDVTKSYLTNKSLPVTKNEFGEFMMDHSLFKSISFSAFFYEYSFNTVANSTKATFFNPDLTIFDARRSLGQYPKYTLKGERNLYKKSLEQEKEPEEEEEIYEQEQNEEEYEQKEELKQEQEQEIYEQEQEELEQKYEQEEEELKPKYEQEEEELEEELEQEYEQEEEREKEFDPFLGYSYSDNTNDNKTGEGYLGEYVRFNSNINELPQNGTMVKFWKSSWHLSTFLPHIDHFLDKLDSYSHFNRYNGQSRQNKIDEIIRRIHNHEYIYGDNDPMDSLKVKISTSEEETKIDMFSYKFWKKVKNEYKINGKSESFNKLNNFILHEIPQQIRENPICYSYMLDRDFGFTKKLWWQVVPKEKWSMVDFSKLDSETLKEISPTINDNNEIIDYES